MDVFTFKRYDWPMQRADAAFQKSYLKKLRKYRIQAVPAGDGDEGSSAPTPGLLGPQPGHYLEMPEISLNIKEENLALEFEYTAYPRGEFRFDERNGWIFLDEVDEYDYMYYAHVDSLFPPSGQDRLPLHWKRSRLVIEKESYTFIGSVRPIHTGSEVYLGWGFCEEGEKRFSKPRWDTRKIARASKFSLRGQQLLVEREIDEKDSFRSRPLFHKAGTRDPR